MSQWRNLFHQSMKWFCFPIKQNDEYWQNLAADLMITRSDEANQHHDLPHKTYWLLYFKPGGG